MTRAVFYFAARYLPVALLAAALSCGVLRDVTAQEILVLQESTRDQEGPGYWIGIACRSVDAELREKLKLDEGEGVAIAHALPGTPSAQAGLSAGDVVLAVDDEPVRGLDQLAQVVSQSQGRRLRLRIARDGQLQDVVVKPTGRPSQVGVAVLEDKAGEQGREEKEQDLERRRAVQLRQPPAVQRPRGVQPPQAPRRVMPPAIAVAPGAPRILLSPAALPDDMQVTIQKRGNKPAKITVTQGDKSWKTTEKELEMLPAEARNYVSRLLGRPAAVQRRGAVPAAPGAAGVGRRVELQLRAAEPQPVPGSPARRLQLRQLETKPDQKSVDQRIRELSEQVKRLQREVQQLRKP